VYVRFWWGNVSERNHLEERGVNGILKLKGCYGNLLEGLVCIDMDM
jgi:hypothetical protein